MDIKNKPEGWFTLEEKRPEDIDNIVFYTKYKYYGKYRLEHGVVLDGYIYQDNSTGTDVDKILVWTYDVKWEIND